MKTPMVPTYEESNRCLEIRRRSKCGDNSYLYSKEQSRFINYMLNTYPEWYKCTEKKIWNDTIPLGSDARVKEGNCDDPEYLKTVVVT